MGYRDNNGIEHESYTDACIYYGADTPEMLRAEQQAIYEEEAIAAQDMIEARGGPAFCFYPADDIPF